MSPSSKPAVVRFYIDADLLGLAKVLSPLRPDLTFPGDPGRIVHKRKRAACPVESPAALDTEWIPVVAREGWLIITRDRRIQEHRAEILAVRDHGAKMVALAARDALNTWQQLEVLFSQWRGIDQLAERPGPFIYTATRTSLRSVDLT